MEANPCLLLQRLHRMVQAITSIGLLGHSVYTVYTCLLLQRLHRMVQAITSIGLLGHSVYTVYTCTCFNERREGRKK